MNETEKNILEEHNRPIMISKEDIPIPLTCRTLISLKKTKSMSFEEASNISLKHTKKTGHETGFLFIEPKTAFDSLKTDYTEILSKREIVSPIRIGDCHSIELHIRNKFYPNLKKIKIDEPFFVGSFHTHPIHNFEKYAKLKLPSEELNKEICEPTIADTYLDTEDDNHITVVGCTTNPYRITEIRRIPIDWQYWRTEKYTYLPK